MKVKNYNHGTRLLRIALVVMAAITFTGVADAQQKVGKQRQGITVKNVRNWTENGNVIPVCWETPGYNREKAIVKAAISNTWERFSGLRFTGWAACPIGGIGGSASVKHVRIRVRDQDGNNAGANGSARTYGMGALSSADDKDPGVNLSFNPDGTADQGRVEYIAVHEFGHVLGFVHEQDTPGNVVHGVAYCTSPGNEPNATSLTAYDPDSVMNYCNKDGNMKGNLTDKDIKGLQAIYGVRTEVSIGDVLLAGKFRTRQQLSEMSAEDRRNTLITELYNRTKNSVSYYQSLKNSDLTGAGALLVYLRKTGSRTDGQIKAMSSDDIRNTLITELVNRTKDTVKHYQSLKDSGLAGAAALLTYLRETGSRTDQQIKTMSADDMRNTVIVEVAARTNRGRDVLQSLNNMDVVNFALERP